MNCKVLFNRMLHRAVNWGYSSELLASIKPTLKSILLEGTIPLSVVARNDNFGVFKDGAGNELHLIKGLRDATKPGWQWICNQRNNEVPDKAKLKAAARKACLTVDKMLSFLSCFDFEIKDKTVLEIGCYDGSKSFALSAAGAAKVVGSDILEYYLSGSISNLSLCDSVKEQKEYLDGLRAAIAEITLGEKITGDMERVRFVEDDIATSALPSDYFDLVCSWEVLEHITEPKRFFHQLFRILKPGGMAFHEYNPFFAINGGHSYCTLDFFWGHVILSDKDFEKYVKKFRPQEVSAALDFYRHSINRMSFADLRRHSMESGFDVLSFIPWIVQPQLDLLKPETIRLGKGLYPSLTVEDLISPLVWVLLRKPSKSYA